MSQSGGFGFAVVDGIVFVGCVHVERGGKGEVFDVSILFPLLLEMPLMISP